jgi:hypothetical protein
MAVHKQQRFGFWMIELDPPHIRSNQVAISSCAYILYGCAARAHQSYSYSFESVIGKRIFAYTIVHSLLAHGSECFRFVCDDVNISTIYHDVKLVYY